jgi:hypothetical protein
MWKSFWAKLVGIIEFMLIPLVLIGIYGWASIVVHRIAELTAPDYHRSVPTVTYVVAKDGSQERRFDSRGYPEPLDAGTGKYIFVPDGNGELTKMYIDADIYVVPMDFSLLEKINDEA